MNKQELIGRLGKDPVEGTAGEYTVCNLSVATTTRRKGEKYTVWENVAVFGKMAENCIKYLKKGSQIYARGNVAESTYTKEGETTPTRVRKVIAEEIEFLSPATKSTESSQKVSDVNELPF
jgi:single-strand DNA-binding protein